MCIYLYIYFMYISILYRQDISYVYILQILGLILQNCMKGIYSKELAYTIMKVDKSQDLQ